jgi:hypothetical protein
MMLVIAVYTQYSQNRLKQQIKYSQTSPLVEIASPDSDHDICWGKNEVHPNTCARLSVRNTTFLKPKIFDVRP